MGQTDWDDYWIDRVGGKLCAIGCEGLPPRVTYGYPKQPTNVMEMKDLVDGNQFGAFAPCYARSDLAKIDTSDYDENDQLERIISCDREAAVSGWANTSEDWAKILRKCSYTRKKW
ncbi:hypothetical protein FVER14953_21384 [Fusarium verticillioides]|nr:hypothetical protein FVER14953_21384 [Fusarium verticillioides]